MLKHCLAPFIFLFSFLFFKLLNNHLIVKDNTVIHTITLVFFFNSHESVILSSSCSRPFQIFFNNSTHDCVSYVILWRKCPCMTYTSQIFYKLNRREHGHQQDDEVEKQILDSDYKDQRIVYNYVNFIFFSLYFNNWMKIQSAEASIWENKKWREYCKYEMLWTI